MSGRVIRNKATMPVPPTYSPATVNAVRKFLHRLV
jgi:hypothetical protein